MKKIISLILVGILSMMSFTGCSKATKVPKSKPVTLKIMLPGDRPADMDIVIAEAEKRMVDTVNVKLDIVFVPWADLATKTQVNLSSGENIDLIFDAPWLHINQMISQGFYEPLEQLLNTHGKNILSARDKEMLDSNKFGGKIYGIPLGNSYYQGITYYVRKDIREKLHIAPIKTYEDLIKYAYEVKAKEKNIIPLATGSEAANRLATDYDLNMKVTHALGSSFMLNYKNNNGKVYNLFDNMEPKVMQYILEARKLYQDKIIFQDVLVMKDPMGLIKSGKAAVVYTNDFGVKSDVSTELKKNVPGAELEAVTFFQAVPGKNISNFKQWNYICVPTVSKNKEKAIEFLNWANQKDNYDLMAYGIKGKNWSPVGDDQYKPLDASYPWFPFAWIWNTKYDRLNSSQDAATIEYNKFTMVPSNFKKDILTGFDFDAAKVANEIAQYQTIEGKYVNAIFGGVVDTDTYLAKFKAQAAPLLKKIQTELQIQIDAFLAKK